MSGRCFGEEELRNLHAVIESGELWRGTQDRFVSRFEDAFSRHLGRSHVLALNSGTSADETALAGLGLEPGDEVICPAAAPIFASMPVVAIGCIPVYADVDPRTLIISPESIDEHVTPRARAVLVVHLFGQPAPMDEIMDVAGRHNLQVVEDCAQAYDCRHKGRKVGTIGDVACFSLQQSKHITSGEGGMIACDDPDIYKRAVLYATCGMPWYRYGLQAPAAEPVAGLPTRGHFAFGHNYRMSELQGAVALAQLEKIAEFNARRREHVRVIESELSGVPGVELPYVYPDTEPNYWCYPLRVPEGLGTYSEVNYLEVVLRQMNEERCTSLGYPLPDYIRYEPGACPNAEAAARRFRTIDVHHGLDVQAIRKEAAQLREAVERHST